MEKKFYLTTAIAYTSSTPHIGNVYEAILADAICRYKRKDGYDVRFQTGTDEHGQKIQEKALKAGVSPKEHVDHVAGELKAIYDMMNVSYDRFIRTTDEDHERTVQDIFTKLYEKGDIYKGHYEGHYCVACESYFTEKDLVNGCCPDCGGPVKLTKEECYFLKLKPYQERLIEHIKTHPEFIQPESRKNEMLNNFLKNDLPDLCVSRTSFTWGVQVPFDPKHVVYVWIDALANYITGLGYSVNGESSPLFKKYWPADIHLIGKDILRFHTIYWPIMLMALDLPLPRQVFGHPWVLTGTDKMSKSKGNVIYAGDLVELYGVDAVRYYVLHEIPFAQDGSITYELVTERYNSDLANILGNLVSRTMAMAKKYFSSKVSYKGSFFKEEAELKNALELMKENVRKHMDSLHVGDAIEDIIIALRRANKYIDETAPWALAKDESKMDALESVIYALLEAIRESAILLEPFIPKTAESIYNQLNVTKTGFDDLAFGTVQTYELGEAQMLFKRIDHKDIVAKLEKMKPQVEIKDAKPSKPLITIADFDKLELCVGKILEAKKHPKADKLLVFKVDVGTDVRQIVSGISKWYDPSDLVGKKVVVVKNLQPVKLRGEESCGMLLCAADAADEELELLNVSKLNPGDEVR